MIREIIPEKLLASSRPGYGLAKGAQVPAETVELWINAAKSSGARSIICLLNEQHLCLYRNLPGGLLGTYASAGFQTGHLPVIDHQSPPMSQDELQSVAKLFEELPKPVLIHCSAGIDRTGAAVRYLKQGLISTDE
jgi:protein-tyrosine phosphatase